MKSTSALYSRYFTYIKPIGKMPIIRNYGAMIFTLLTISVLTFFAIRPTVQTILVLQKQLEDAEQILQKVNEKAKNLSLGQQNYDALDDNIKEKIMTAIPDSLSLKSVVSSLEQTARQYEASISALQVQPLTVAVKAPNQIGQLSEISFIFNVEGAYPNLMSLLEDLRASNRLISIDDLSLSKTSEGSGLIMSLTGKAYYIK